jgi:ferredoxin
MSKSKLLLCNCNRTMPLDARALAGALKLNGVPHLSSELCRRHLGTFDAAVKSGDDLLVACTQEAPLFSELQAELKPEKSDGTIRFVNIRETAGWSQQAEQATPKIAALLALADLPEPEPVPVVSYQSGGQLLIIGQAAAALDWAERLAEQLQVCVLITGEGGRAELPLTRRYPVYSGHRIGVKGYLGAFEVSWEQANPIDLEACTRCNACIEACPEQAIDYGYQIDLAKCKAHRACVKACGEVRAIDFERTERRRDERFDLVLDLCAEPHIRLHQPPQGYAAPGKDALAQALAAAQLVQQVGEFEKPKFFVYREKICAHSRSEITGCTQCVDVCSTGAISSDLEANRVVVEPHLCMGCGACASVCPSGAMSYAYPRLADLGLRVKTVLQTYRNAGGAAPCLLLHNTSDGRERVAQLGRRGRGLPASVIPLEVLHVAALGMDLMLGSIALGAARFVILAAGSEAPEYLASLRRQLGYAQEILAGLGYGSGHFSLIEAGDAKALEQALWQTHDAATACPPASFNLPNDKRGALDFALDHLARHAPAPQEVLALSAGAPYGAVQVNAKTCTLCMACVGACPEGALLDAKDAPQLKFIERNCVQCGLCQKTCPEDAISLVPRLLLGRQAKAEVVLNAAEPFQCVRCAKPFGTRQMIESMLGRLSAHSMFASAEAQRRLQMCADCRVIDMMENRNEAGILDYTGGTDKGRS